MGHHYAPQHYLKGFLKNLGEEIWAYDKQTGKVFSANVKKVANINEFYTPKLESYLSLLRNSYIYK